MSNTRQLSGEWTPCPDGILSSMAGDERFRQRRQFLVQTSSAAGAVAIAAGAGWFIFHEGGITNEPTFGGIACSRVRQLIPDFMVQQLDTEVTQQITVHLAQCEACRKYLDSMQTQSAQAVSDHQSVAVC